MRTQISPYAIYPSSSFPCSAAFYQFFKPITLPFLYEVVGQQKSSGSPQMQSHPDYLKEVISALGPVRVSNSSLSLTVTPKDFRLMCSTLWLCRERCYINKILINNFSSYILPKNKCIPLDHYSPTEEFCPGTPYPVNWAMVNSNDNYSLLIIILLIGDNIDKHNIN